MLTRTKGKYLQNLRLLSSIVLGLGWLASSPMLANEPIKYHRAVIIRFDGEIDPGLQRLFYRKLDVAKQQGADLVIVEINSPGGRLQESKEIAERLEKLPWANTVAYIPREAISGAAIVAMGCDEILMEPHAGSAMLALSS